MKNYLLVLFLFSSSLFSQELAVYAGKMWTGNDELQNPVNYSASISRHIWKIAVRFEFSYAKNEVYSDGILFGGFIYNPEEALVERIRTSSFIHSYELSVMLPEFEFTRNIFARLGGGISLDYLFGNRYGFTSNERKELYETDKYGYLLYGEIGYRNPFGLPFKVHLNYKQKFLNTSNMATDVDDPFSSNFSIEALRLGISYGIF